MNINLFFRVTLNEPKKFNLILKGNCFLKAQGNIIIQHSSKLSIISDLFHILTYMKVNCFECGNYFLKYDPPMSSISLPIPNLDVPNKVLVF